MDALAHNQTLPELTLGALDVRAAARRVAIPAVVAGVGVAIVLLAAGHVHEVGVAIRRGLDINGAWAAVAAAFECISLAGYVALMSLVAGRATSRINARVSAQITLTGAAATRLLPTAGVGGAGLAVWTMRRAGLKSAVAARTLLAFFVLLYAVFLGAIVVSGAMLTFGLADGHGPTALSAIPAAAALVAIVLALGFAFGGRAARAESAAGDRQARGLRLRVAGGVRLVGGAVRDACGLLGSGDPRLAGAAAYWAFDAAVLWAMLHAFGSPPAVPVIVLAYFVGQAATAIPIPGAVSGGIAGVLIAFGVSPELAVPAVLAYRAVSVWLPTPIAIAAVPGLRATIARWGREDAAAPASS